MHRISDSVGSNSVSTQTVLKMSDLDVCRLLDLAIQMVKFKVENESRPCSLEGKTIVKLNDYVVLCGFDQSVSETLFGNKFVEQRKCLESEGLFLL